MSSEGSDSDARDVEDLPVQEEGHEESAPAEDVESSSVAEAADSPKKEEDVVEAKEESTVVEEKEEAKEPVREEEEEARPVLDVNPGTVLHVSNLTSNTRDADLEKVFSEYGKVKSTQVMINPQTRQSRRFAFVEMESGAVSDMCVGELSGKIKVDGNVLTVAKARRGGPRTRTPGQYRGPVDSRDRYHDRSYPRPPRRYEPYDRYEPYPRRSPPVDDHGDRGRITYPPNYRPRADYSSYDRPPYDRYGPPDYRRR